MICRLLLLPAVGLVLLAVTPAFFQPRDFVEYWSAARVLAAGGDPYDATQLLPVQRVATGNPALAEVVSLWTPPWTLPLYRPFGFEPFAVARHLWIALQLLLIAVSVELLWRVYCSRDTGLRAGVPSTGPEAGAANSFLPHLLALAFAPVFWTLFYGQNTGIPLLGLAGFLYFRTRGRPGLAGAFAALTALKPHLLAVFGVVVVLDALTKPGRKALLAGVAVIAAGAVAAVLMNPDVFQQFLASVRRPRTPEAIALSEWQVPLIAYQLRMAFAPDLFAVQFVPCLLMAAAAVPYYWVRRKWWDWQTELPRLVLASAIFAPYGAWIFDLTVLLVPVLAGAALVTKADGFSHRAAGLPFAVLFLGGIQPLMLEQFIWFAPAVAVLWAATVRFAGADRIAEPTGEFRVSGGAPRAVSP